MASNASLKLGALRRFSKLFRIPMLSSHNLHHPINPPFYSSPFPVLLEPSNPFPPPLPIRLYSSRSLDNDHNRSVVLQEDDFHKLADSTIQHLLERFEEYGDGVQMEGFDIDYGNQVLTLKLGDLGTYVLNKQTPNKQLWLSSPVSGPARFDWDAETKSWVYLRNNANLRKLLENELKQLCGEPIDLS